MNIYARDFLQKFSIHGSVATQLSINEVEMLCFTSQEV